MATTLQELYRALEAADASGNKEDAQRLADYKVPEQVNFVDAARGRHK